jgi:hypothetical protein
MLRAWNKTSGALHQVVLAPLLTVVLAVPATALTAEAEWTLERDEENIQLYTRSVPDSPFLEVKATTLINASIEKVAQTFGYGDGCSEWQAMCKSSEVLSTVSETERYVYLVLDLPWPLADRDMVIHSSGQIDREAGTVTVHLKSDSSKHPLQDYLRAESHGQYQIKGFSDEQVEFTYIMRTDLGGDVSPDIINPRLAESMHSDVASLRALAEK